MSRAPRVVQQRDAFRAERGEQPADRAAVRDGAGHPSNGKKKRVTGGRRNYNIQANIKEKRNRNQKNMHKEGEKRVKYGEERPARCPR